MLFLWDHGGAMPLNQLHILLFYTYYLFFLIFQIWIDKGLIRLFNLQAHLKPVHHRHVAVCDDKLEGQE